jgi:hypothetical protein
VTLGLEPELQDATERWFIRRGIPHFIDGYNASEDVFTRALPLLSLVFVIEVVSAADVNWLWWQNLGALVAGVGLLLLMYTTYNRVLGRRPLLRRPDTVGVPELLGFVFVPALLPLVIGGRGTSFAVVAGVNVLVLAVVYFVILFGVVPMTRWAIVHMWGQFGGVLRLMARSLPLVLVFSMFIFLNAEAWQVAADFTPGYFALAAGVLVGVASLFVLLRLPREIDALRKFSDWGVVCDFLSDAPLDPTHVEGLTDTPDPPKLTRMDWLNVGLIWLFSQAVQIVLVGSVITLFYVVFGTFTVRESTILQWTTSQGVSGWRPPGTDLLVTWELITVSGFIGAFSALQFAISAVTDETYREEFLADLVHDLREAFAVRAVYLARLGVTVSR